MRVKPRLYRGGRLVETLGSAEDRLRPAGSDLA